MKQIYDMSKVIDLFKDACVEWSGALEDLDRALVETAVKVCNHDSYIGAGIERSAFSFKDFVIKVSKEFYVDINDEIAEDDFNQWCDEEDEDKTCYYNYLEDMEYSKCESEQGLQEIKNYEAVLNSGIEEIQNHFAEIYCCSSNGNIIVMEKCEPAEDVDEELLSLYDSLYEDIHCDNVGLNKDNRMVVLDLGFAFHWDEIYIYFGVEV